MAKKIAVLRPVPEAGIELLARAGHEIERGEAVEGASGLLVPLTLPVDEALLARAGARLEVVANFGVGYDNIDVAAASRRGVLVTNTPGVLTDATADLAMALLLAVARRLAEGDRLVRSGNWTGWEPLQMLGADLAGSTLAIVGAGRIGQALARRARAFELELIHVARREVPEMAPLGSRRVSLEDALRQADFVSLHLPLRPDTRHLVGRRELALMKPSAFLINTARGAIVDEAALGEALAAGRLAGAGLDVYEDEPRLTPGLVALDNVVLLPHLGSATVRTRDRMSRLAAANLLEALAGRRPANLVNPEAWDDQNSRRRAMPTREPSSP